MSHDDIYDPKDPNMIYVRPNPGARPIRYEQSTALQGLLLDQKQAIAILTSRAGMNVGPPGTAGNTPDVWDTIIASASDEYSPLLVGGPKTTFRAPYQLDMTNGYVRASLTTAPSGADLVIDVHMNGTSMFTTPIHIEPGSRTSVGAATQSVIAIPGMLVPDDAEFWVYVDSFGAGTGTGLKIAVTGKKVPI